MSNTSLILAVDTSSPVAGFAISRGGTIVASMTVNTGRPHSQSFFSAISALCRIGGIGLEEIGLFAAVTGPGSFTGLRVGLAAVKGLADSLGKPATGRPALDLLALSTGLEGLHLIILAAGRGEVFCGVREVNAVGEVARVAEDRVCPPSRIMALFPELAKATVVLEDGLRSGPDELQSYSYRMVQVHRDRINLAVHLAVAAGRAFESEPPQSLIPHYIRPSDAEIMRKP